MVRASPRQGEGPQFESERSHQTILHMIAHDFTCRRIVVMGINSIDRSRVMKIARSTLVTKMIKV